MSSGKKRQSREEVDGQSQQKRQNASSGGGGGAGGPCQSQLVLPDSRTRHSKRSTCHSEKELNQNLSGPWNYIKDGENCKEVVQKLLVQKLLCDSGKECVIRDAVGANPFHLSVLYTKSNSSLSKDTAGNTHNRSLGWQEKPEHEEIAKEIWGNKELQHLRTESYDRGDYEGETALHLMIAKRRDGLVEDFLKALTPRDEAVLLNSRVVGTFDLAHFETHSGVKRCKFGEHPICWAACTNQKKTFDLLRVRGAELGCTLLDCTTLQGDTILHMLVRWSGWLEDRSVESDPFQSHEDNPDTEWLLKMFDHVEGKMLDQMSQRLIGKIEDNLVERQVYMKLALSATNQDKLTPLLLASSMHNSERVASKSMFNHLVKKYVQKLWIFGPYHGISLDVTHFDPIAAAMHDVPPKMVVAKSDDIHVLKILVREQNADLISNKYIQALLDTKWEKYARDELHFRLFQTVLMLWCLVEAQLLPLTTNPKLLSAFYYEQKFTPLMATRNFIFVYFCGQVFHYLFSAQTPKTDNTHLRNNMWLFGILILDDFPPDWKLPAIFKHGAAQQSLLRVGCVIWVAYFLIIQKLIMTTFHSIPSYECKVARDKEGGQRKLGNTTKEAFAANLKCACNFAASKLTVEVTFVVFCLFTVGLDMLMAWCFFTDWKESDETDVAVEFAVWQNLVFLFILPVAFVKSRTQTKREWAKLQALCVVAVSFVITFLAPSEYCTHQDAGSASNALVCWCYHRVKWLGKPFLDGTPDDKGVSTSAADQMIRMASCRTKLTVWGFLFIGTFYISRVEFMQWSQINVTGTFIAQQKQRTLQYLQPESRLQMLQNITSSLLFPSAIFMICAQFSDVGETGTKGLQMQEYLMTTILALCLLMRLLIYLLGIEKMARNVLLLYEARTDFMYIFFFYLILHGGFSFVVVMQSRFRLDSNSNFTQTNSNITQTNSNITQTQLKHNATKFFSDIFAGALRAMMDHNSPVELFKDKLAPKQEGKGRINAILEILRLIGFTFVPFVLSSSILGAMMSKHGDKYQKQASTSWNMARSMIIMSIDEEIIANQEDLREYFEGDTNDDCWLFKETEDSCRVSASCSRKPEDNNTDPDWETIQFENPDLFLKAYDDNQERLQTRTSLSFAKRHAHRSKQIREKDGKETIFDFVRMVCSDQHGVAVCCSVVQCVRTVCRDHTRAPNFMWRRRDEVGRSGHTASSWVR